jgi:hypothetical protein
MLLESSHQIVLAIWIGSLVGIASLAVPTLLDAVGDSTLAVRVALDLLGRLSFLGCGAGGFLLLTTMLMYLLNLRGARAAVGQAALILAMALLATGLQIWFAPRLSALLRQNPSLFAPNAAAPELARFRALFALYLGLILTQALCGAALLLMGVRRWYRYITIRRGGTEVFWP